MKIRILLLLGAAVVAIVFSFRYFPFRLLKSQRANSFRLCFFVTVIAIIARLTHSSSKLTIVPDLDNTRCRNRLYHQKFAWTPFYSEALYKTTGGDRTYNDILRVAYVIGAKTAANALWVNTDKYVKIAIMSRTGVAYAKYKRGAALQVTCDVGEIDGYNSNTSRV